MFPVLPVQRLETAARTLLTLAVIHASLLGAPDVAYSNELHLIVNGKAIHLGQQDGVDYNEENWGAGLQYDFVRSHENWIPFVNASTFRDSNRNTSWYAGGGSVRRFQVGRSDRMHIDLGAIAFVMRRKDFHDGNPFLGLLPVASVGTERVSVNVTYIPKVDPKMVPIIFFQVKVRLGKGL